MTEMFHRNETKPAIQDISVRTFNLKDMKIFLKYHYDNDCITASTREYTKPPKPDYGQEIKYDPDATGGYTVRFLNF